MPEEAIDPSRTALVIIDLQVRIVGRDVEPRTGADVVRQSIRLAGAFRERGGQVVIVQAERPQHPQPPGSELVDEMRPQGDDLLITKRAWNAFHETPLHEELSKRGITTLVLAGIATSFGVESTARTASDYGYELWLVEDAMAGLTAAAHRFAVEEIFPLLGTVCRTDDVLGRLART